MSSKIYFIFYLERRELLSVREVRLNLLLGLLRGRRRLLLLHGDLLRGHVRGALLLAVAVLPADGAGPLDLVLGEAALRGDVPDLAAVPAHGVVGGGLGLGALLGAVALLPAVVAEVEGLGGRGALPPDVPDLPATVALDGHVHALGALEHLVVLGPAEEADGRVADVELALLRL